MPPSATETSASAFGRPQVPSIDALPDNSRAPDLFVVAVERIAAPTEIVIQGVERTGATRVATTEFRYGTALAKAKAFRFDAAGRLLQSDLFTLSMKRHNS